MPGNGVGAGERFAAEDYFILKARIDAGVHRRTLFMFVMLPLVFPRLYERA